uniref:Uncharacterized protein n=1 Tax=Nicotiana tabacum TaxID=4097 RepID=A0A1S3YMY8_TOBAC|nr:PREDICTED: uncharacterized protein LOC107777995 [Nicotiana tabacum]
MEIYAEAYDVKVWRVIKKGNYPLSAAAQPLAHPKDIDLYIDEQMAVVHVNNKLEVTYEGTNKVKETHINMLVHDYELFQMKEGESIEEMFARFSKMISDLKVFGKPYSSGDQDLNKLSYDELRGELIAFEKTHLKKTNQEEKKKTVTCKATTEIAENDINDDPKTLREEIAMMSRNMDDLIKRFRNKKSGRIPPKQISWSDEDSSKYEEVANLCFMTILENDMNKLSRCWIDEDTSDDECKDNNEYCFMARGETNEGILDLTLKESQKMMDELKRLNKEIKDWKLKHEVCEIEKEVLQEMFEESQMKFSGMRKSPNHSSISSNQTTYKSTGKRTSQN